MKIRIRLTLWIAVAGLITSLLFSLAVFFEMAEKPVEMVDLELKAVGNSVVSLLEQQPCQNQVENLTKLPVFYNSYWIRIYDHQKIIYQTDMARQTDLPIENHHKYTIETQLKQQDGEDQKEQDDICFRVRLIQLQPSNHPLLIQLARPMEDLDKDISELIIFLVLGLMVSTILLILIGYYAAGQVLQPINSINFMAKEINEKTLNKRIPLGKSHDELYQLSTSLNQMFDRLQYSFAQQKQFFASASHELKTPLTMLRLFMDEAVNRRDLDESFKQQMINQRINLFRMDRLVKTLLDLSALELKEMIEKENFNLTGMIETVLEDFTAVILSNNIQLTTKLQHNLQLRGDQDKIRRLLINILDNAIKYNYEGPKIALEASGNEKIITISLFNTGQGIPEAELEKVFEQFYRVEKSRSLQYGGTGLGLAIVKKIVILHHGSVKMESKKGEWAKIEINLPDVGK